MYYCKLKKKAIICIEGKDATSFLQGIITNNTNKLKNNRVIYSTLLSPQGKLLHDFFLFEDMKKFYLDAPKYNIKKLKEKLKDNSIIIQGFGKVGKTLALDLYNRDQGKIIAIGDASGYLINQYGIDINKLSKHYLKNKKIDQFKGAKFIKKAQDVLLLNCDILIPAATESVISINNVNKIKAKLIIEAANGPITYRADQILNKRGVHILPDIFVNAGGVVVSYYEWVKNLSHIRFGRLQRRFDEQKMKDVIDVIEKTTNRINEKIF